MESQLPPHLAALADRLMAVGAVKFGAFRLKKHEREPDAPLSPYFFNLRTPQNPKPGNLDPESVEEIVDAMEQLLTADRVPIGYVVPLPNAGDPFGYCLAERNGFPLALLRKEEADGKRRIAGMAEGFVPPDEPWQALMVDDLVTQADTKLEGREVLESAGAEVRHAVVLIDREQGGREQLARAGITLHAVFTVTQLLNHYLATGAIDQAKYDEAKAYLAAEREEAGLLPGKGRIIVALDVDSIEKALSLVRELKDHVGQFKVGLELLFVILVQLLTPSDFREAVVNLMNVRDLFALIKGRTMLDGKFKDIHNTMAGAARGAARLGVRMFTVHASASPKGMASAVKERGRAGVIAVTVLTSMDDETCTYVYGQPTAKKVVAFARDAIQAGAQYLVCSAQDLAALDSPEFAALRKITPGVRSEGAAPGDQIRVLTPAEAVKAGATYIVVGREITQPKGETSVEAAQRIAAAIDAALAA